MRTNDAIDRFLMDSQVGGIANSTLDKYRQQLTQWARSMPETLEEISYETLLEYFAAWGVGPKTRRNVITLVKQLFQYVNRVGYVDAHDPAQPLRLPRLKKQPPRFLTAAEVKRLITICRQPLLDRESDRWYVYRNVAIVVTLAETGLRVSELCNLRRCNIHLTEHYADVVVKGDKRNTVVFNERTVNALREHWDRQDGGVYCIENPNGDQVSTGGVRRLFNRLSERLGRRVYPHLLRHTCATHMIKKAVNVFYVQQQLGHESLDTTLNYTHTNIEDRVAAHRSVLD